MIWVFVEHRSFSPAFLFHQNANRNFSHWLNQLRKMNWNWLFPMIDQGQLLKRIYQECSDFQKIQPFDSLSSVPAEKYVKIILVCKGVEEYVRETKQLPDRADLPEALTWDLTKIYADDGAFEERSKRSWLS